MLLISHWLPPSNMHFLTRQLSCSNDGYVHTQQPLAALYSVHIMCLLMACLNIFLHKASQESCVQLFKSLDNLWPLVNSTVLQLFGSHIYKVFFRYWHIFSTIFKWGQQDIIIHRPPLSEMSVWGQQQHLKHVYKPYFGSSDFTCHKLKYLTMISGNCGSLSFLPGRVFPKRSIAMSKTAGVGLSSTAIWGLPQLNSDSAPNLRLPRGPHVCD